MLPRFWRKIVKPFRPSLDAFTRRVREAALLVDETNYNSDLGVSKLSLEQTRRIRSCRGLGSVKFGTKSAQSLKMSDVLNAGKPP